MKPTQQGIGNTAQLLALARDVLAELALQDELPESSLELESVVHTLFASRAERDGQLGQAANVRPEALAAALNLLTVVCVAVSGRLA